MVEHDEVSHRKSRSPDEAGPVFKKEERRCSGAPIEFLKKGKHTEVELAPVKPNRQNRKSFWNG
jgi:hypothetical protein